MINSPSDAPETVVFFRVAVLLEFNILKLQGPHEEHRLLEMNVVISDSVIKLKRLAFEGVYFVQEAGNIVAW